MQSTLLGGSGMQKPEPLYYYVQEAQCFWTLATVEEGWVSPVGYPTRDEAVAAAIELAQQDWLAQGRPTGVRVRLRSDAGWDERVFGVDSAAPMGIAT
jgi:hypothetical protein